MKNRKKALLLSCLTSLVVLTGCGSATKTIQIEGETYIQSGEEYVKVNVAPKTFEPGEHVISYLVKPNDGSSINNGDLYEGYNNPWFNLNEVPDGYRVIGFTDYSTNRGYSNYLVFILVNDETVEVEGSYDARTNSVVYLNPGKVIDSPKLNLGE